MLNKFKIMNDKYLAFTQDFSLNISRLDYFRFLSMSTLVIHDAPTSRVEIKPQLVPQVAAANAPVAWLPVQI